MPVAMDAVASDGMPPERSQRAAAGDVPASAGSNGGYPRRRAGARLTPYALRHTFATNALAAGINLYELARYMGTSVEMVDRTYGHLAPGAEQSAAAKLDAFGR